MILELLKHHQNIKKDLNQFIMLMFHKIKIHIKRFLIILSNVNSISINII